MIAPDQDVETLSWYYDEMDGLEDLTMLEDGEVGVAVHGEGDIQGTDDEIGRAWEDLEALTDSA